MAALNKELQDFFKDYEKAFSELDADKQAGFFADTFISAGPKGAIAPGKAEFKIMAAKAAEFYKKAGQEYAEIITSSETKISDDYILVRIHWKVNFKKYGNKSVEFDVSYIVHITGKPEIIMFISHEDEAETMQALQKN